MEFGRNLLAFAILIGPGIIAVAVLWYGVTKAQSTAAVLACAAVATLLFAASLFLLFFLAVFSDSSGGGVLRPLFWMALFAAPAAVIAFLGYKLPRTWDKTRTPYDAARIAAAIVLAYSIVTAVSTLLHAGPLFWAGLWVAAGLALSSGLWRHASWAWYAGVAASAFALLLLIWIGFVPWPSNVAFVLRGPTGLGLVLLLLFLGVLLSSNARERCLRKATP